MTPTTPIEPVAAAYRTEVEAGSLRGPDVSPPGRAPYSIATAMARGLGADWSLPAVLERCRETLRESGSTAAVPVLAVELSAKRGRG